MKRLVISLFLVITLCSCSVTNENTEPSDDMQNIQDEQQDDEGASVSMDFGDIQVNGDTVILHMKMTSTPFRNVDNSMIALQNGIPVPFSFEQGGEYTITKRQHYDQEAVDLTLYLHPYSYRKGEQVSFGIGLVKNPDYMPEIMEFTRYDITKQFIAMHYRSYKMDVEYNQKDEDPHILEDVTWQEAGEGKGTDNIASVCENDDIDVLKAIINGTLVNDMKQIYATNEGTFEISLLTNKVYGMQGYVTFYIDHQPIKIENIYDTAIFQYTKDGFGIANFQLSVPPDIAKGNHTFYVAVSGHDKNSEISSSFITNQRVIVIE